MGRRIHALGLPIANPAFRCPASRIPRAVRVDNAARDSVPDTGSTGSSDQRL
ncbi:hypothetical protein [Streptomyces ureilyticus]|uniref:Uncharacterized protein n=1 Tax=Streptomyces ureilyticus TaxID=1775131 RepID=A0ABX0E520_9ACTN|nr:hypothetical protein [Streptomyces ureilyticus]NGO49300.1 hypothetical protein [Streptomyces ureilyticus]